MGRCGRLPGWSEQLPSLSFCSSDLYMRHIDSVTFFLNASLCSLSIQVYFHFCINNVARIHISVLNLYIRFVYLCIQIKFFYICIFIYPCIQIKFSVTQSNGGRQCLGNGKSRSNFLF